MLWLIYRDLIHLRCSSFSSSGNSEWPVNSLSGQFPEIKKKKSLVSFKGKVSVIEILSAGWVWKNFSPYRYLRKKWWDLRNYNWKWELWRICMTVKGGYFEAYLVFNMFWHLICFLIIPKPSPGCSSAGWECLSQWKAPLLPTRLKYIPELILNCFVV